MENIQARFLAKVLKTESCWIWQAAIGTTGYGNFQYEGNIQGSHRVSYQLFKGSIPKNLCVLHTCDERSCVNPDHLWLGTKGDNARDAVAKGRWVDNSGPKQDFCIRAHYLPDTKDTYGNCRLCASIRAKGYRANKICN